MKKLLLSLVAGLLISLGGEAYAQNYNNALGVRIGNYNGLNFKTFTGSNKAFDLNLSFRDRGNAQSVFFTALYQVHNPIAGAPGLQWYYGGGGTIGSYKVDGFEGDLFLSADGVLGLDYKIEGAPINLALDWRPRLSLTPDTDFGTSDIGVAIRFTF